ncbi:Endonuclease/exonuclease/phosphatase family protein [Rhynchospora pubera]|uniref:Endonuclease/exonuclease/phosphatase family protein n=1 Tax=Rhynchospora pubera TaxID=906938 RepID=A0AAV8DKK5_9POAL|nr:Endonuclease/exonuclease/phosphatase family protein [Rhynchospora pubera]
MNAISWNCRGIGGTRRKQFLKDSMHATRASFVFLSETKASYRRMYRFMRSVPGFKFCIVPARGLSGGLCLAWRDDLDAQILHTSQNHIAAYITMKGKPPWVLVGIYGDPSHYRNRELWQNLSYVIGANDLVCLMGDFNEILNGDEKFGGSSRVKSSTVDFKNFVFENGLIDMGYKGPAYTWTNKRGVSQAIFQRLDRVLVTSSWLHQFPNAYVN